MPNDKIKSVEGVAVSLVNANQVFGQVFSWQPGKEIAVTLEREGKEVVVKTKLTQSYTMGNSLKPKKDPTAVQLELRKAWLKG